MSDVMEESKCDSDECEESVDREQNEMQKNKKKTKSIHIDMNVIPCIKDEEQEEELKNLDITAYNQSVYEEGVMRQMDEAMDDMCGQTRATALRRMIGDECDNNKSELNCDNERIVRKRKLESISSDDELNVTNDEIASDEEWVPSDDQLDEEGEEREFEEQLDLDECADVDSESNVVHTKRKAKQKLLNNYKREFNAKTARRKIIDDGNEKSYQKRIKYVLCC